MAICCVLAVPLLLGGVLLATVGLEHWLKEDTCSTE